MYSKHVDMDGFGSGSIHRSVPWLTYWLSNGLKNQIRPVGTNGDLPESYMQSTLSIIYWIWTLELVAHKLLSVILQKVFLEESQC